MYSLRDELKFTMAWRIMRGTHMYQSKPLGFRDSAHFFAEYPEMKDRISKGFAQTYLDNSQWMTLFSLIAQRVNLAMSIYGVTSRMETEKKLYTYRQRTSFPYTHLRALRPSLIAKSPTPQDAFQQDDMAIFQEKIAFRYPKTNAERKEMWTGAEFQSIPNTLEYMDILRHPDGQLIEKRQGTEYINIAFGIFHLYIMFFEKYPYWCRALFGKWTKVLQDPHKNFDKSYLIEKTCYNVHTCLLNSAKRYGLPCIINNENIHRVYFGVFSLILRKALIPFMHSLEQIGLGPLQYKVLYKPTFDKPIQQQIQETKHMYHDIFFQKPDIVDSLSHKDFGNSLETMVQQGFGLWHVETDVFVGIHLNDFCSTYLPNPDSDK